MPPLRVLAVCGSLQADSGNLRLLRRLADSKVAGVDLHLSEVLPSLPHFNPDLRDGPVLAPVEQWRQQLSACDGLVIACPEYGHSLPGALKNGIDWVIGSGELYRKTVAITAAVPHADRGLRGLAALKQTLLAVDAQVVWDQALVNPTEVELQRLLLALRAGMLTGMGQIEG